MRLVKYKLKTFDILLDYFLATIIYFSKFVIKKSKYKGMETIDSASFYCPYIPLTIHHVNTNQNMNKVILPIIRRVMPNIIAQDIIGVQPMTGTIGQVHTLKARYQLSKIYQFKVILVKVKKYFIKLKNNIWYKIQKVFYPYEYPVSGDIAEQCIWLHENINQYRWKTITFNFGVNVLFRNKSDLMGFKLRFI